MDTLMECWPETSDNFEVCELGVLVLSSAGNRVEFYWG